MPFDGFLGPPSDMALLTRILHHLRTDYITFVSFVQSGPAQRRAPPYHSTHSREMIMPSSAPATTSRGVWPNSSRSCFSVS